ncbi:MAG: hypothetical protein A2085_04905 [Gemmatimonadetes bacterium GWC2_71_10]|nr:MAG: hypothetical protein A2085_04905 [Gemmatimonadetes bacterium GWC2_71_10]
MLAPSPGASSIRRRRCTAVRAASLRAPCSSASSQADSRAARGGANGLSRRRSPETSSCVAWPPARPRSSPEASASRCSSGRRRRRSITGTGGPKRTAASASMSRAAATSCSTAQPAGVART